MKSPFRKLPHRHIYRLTSNYMGAFAHFVLQMSLALLDFTASSLKNSLRVDLCVRLLYSRFLETWALVLPLSGTSMGTGRICTHLLFQKCPANDHVLQGDESTLLTIVVGIGDSKWGLESQNHANIIKKCSKYVQHFWKSRILIFLVSVI